MDDVDDGLRSWEAAERLGTTSAEVYRLLFTGAIAGGPDREGIVRFPQAEVERVARLDLPLGDPSPPADPPPLRAYGYEGPTSVEVAERFGISADDLYRLLFAGEIEGGPDVYGQVRFSEADVERLAAERQLAP